MKRRKIILLLIFQILTLFVFEACGTVEKEQIDNSVEYEVNILEEIQNEIVDEGNNMEAQQEKFISDFVGQPNEYGNNWANLSLNINPSGRITMQDDWIYYYKYGAIYKKQMDEERIFLINANDAYSLNVIGDWIYYKEGETVYRIRTDGEKKEELLTNVVSNIFIAKGYICYVVKENISATAYKYFLKVDMLKDTESNIIETMYEIEFGEYCPIIIGFNPDKHVMYLHSGKEWSYDDKLVVLEYDYSLGEFQVIISAPTSIENEYNGKEESVKSITAFMNNDYIFYMVRCQTGHVGAVYIYNINESTVIVESLEYTCFNASNFVDDGIIAINYMPLNAGMCLSYDSIDEIKSTDFTRNIIIKETGELGIGEVYVLGDNIYYTPDAQDYYGRTLYKVKLDGTQWEEVY